MLRERATHRSTFKYSGYYAQISELTGVIPMELLE